MNDLQVFGFEGRNVRVVEKDGNPWWVGRDVCEVLGYANSRDAISTFCKGVAVSYPLSTDGGVQEVRIIAEPDVLRLIVGSRLPEAERFEAWVFEEVLPSIRKTGAYGIPKITKAPPATLVSSVNRSVSLKILSTKQAEMMILASCTSKPKGVVNRHTIVQAPALPSIPPLDTFLSLPDFAGWREKLENMDGCFERMGVRLIQNRAGAYELAIDHNHKALLKLAGKDYKAKLRTDPAYIETRQVYIARCQVSAMMFDWEKVRRR